MDLWTVIRVLARRWLIVLIGIVLTLGASAYLYLTAPPSYAAGARMLLLLPPNARGPETVGSPFLYLPDGLNLIARLTIGTTTQRPFREAMETEGMHSTFTVGLDPATPTIVVQVEGPDSANVLATRDWLVEMLDEELRELQAQERAPASQTAHARVFALDDEPVQLGGSWMRNVLATVAVGGIVTLLAAFVTDGVVQRRRASRTGGAVTVSGGPEGSDGSLRRSRRTGPVRPADIRMKSAAGRARSMQHRSAARRSKH